MSNIDWKELAQRAWQARRNAHLYGSTAVGAAVLCSNGAIYSGCNVEHRFRSHDIHAEVNAIGSMVAGGEKSLIAILVVAEREAFTPCGACLDWIFEMGGADCYVGYQRSPEPDTAIFRAADLMPHYPK